MICCGISMRYFIRFPFKDPLLIACCYPIKPPIHSLPYTASHTQPPILVGEVSVRTEGSLPCDVGEVSVRTERSSPCDVGEVSVRTERSSPCDVGEVSFGTEGYRIAMLNHRPFVRCQRSLSHSTKMICLRICSQVLQGEGTYIHNYCAFPYCKGLCLQSS